MAYVEAREHMQELRKELIIIADTEWNEIALKYLTVNCNNCTERCE
jgi:hypothetical protein